MTTPKMIITARRPALLAGHDNELDVLVRIQAPAELPLRNPLHQSLVIDRPRAAKSIGFKRSRDEEARAIPS